MADTGATILILHHPIDTAELLEFTMKYIPNEITENLMERN